MNEEILLNKIIELTRENERLKLELEIYKTKEVDKNNINFSAIEKLFQDKPRKRCVGIKNEKMFKL